MPIGNFPEMLSQRILVGIILVGRLGVRPLRGETKELRGDEPRAALGLQRDRCRFAPFRQQLFFLVEASSLEEEDRLRSPLENLRLSSGPALETKKTLEMGVG